MTILEEYNAKLSAVRKKIGEGQATPMDAFAYQELKYRISNLETLNAIGACTPVTTDKNVISLHYEVTALLLKNLVDERCTGSRTDDEGKKKRETAKNTLISIYNSGAKKSKNLIIDSDQVYKKYISEFVNAFIPVWMQYRDTLFKI